MKKPNITEGEWQVDNWSDGSMSVLSAQDDGFIDQLCEMNETIDAKIQSNAKAISAVPDMIDALIDVLKDWSRDDLYEPYRELSVETIMKIEGALKKAGCE